MLREEPNSHKNTEEKVDMIKVTENWLKLHSSPSFCKPVYLYVYIMMYMWDEESFQIPMQAICAVSYTHLTLPTIYSV